MKKKTACILVLMLILTLVCAFPALSSEPVSGESLAEVDVDASAFLAGQNTDSKANVRGVLFAAGYNVEAGGVSEYAIAAGYNVLLSGDVENDTILAGNIVSINGNVGRDVYAAAQNISISGNVARNVYAAGNSVTVSGTVLGDLDIAAAQIMISENAVIEGTLRYNSSAEIVAPESVLLSAEAYADESEENTEVSASSQITGTIISKIFSYVGVLILALLLLLATPLWETVDKKYEWADVWQICRSLWYRTWRVGSSAGCFGHHYDYRIRLTPCLYLIDAVCRSNHRSTDLYQLLCRKAPLAWSIQEKYLLSGRACYRRSGLAYRVEYSDPFDDYGIGNSAAWRRYVGASSRQEESGAGNSGFDTKHAGRAAR